MKAFAQILDSDRVIEIGMDIVQDGLFDAVIGGRFKKRLTKAPARIAVYRGRTNEGKIVVISPRLFVLQSVSGIWRSRHEDDIKLSNYYSKI